MTATRTIQEALTYYTRSGDVGAPSPGPIDGMWGTRTAASLTHVAGDGSVGAHPGPSRSDWSAVLLIVPTIAARATSVPLPAAVDRWLSERAASFRALPVGADVPTTTTTRTSGDAPPAVVAANPSSWTAAPPGALGVAALEARADAAHPQGVQVSGGHGIDVFALERAGYKSTHGALTRPRAGSGWYVVRSVDGGAPSRDSALAIWIGGDGAHASRAPVPPSSLAKGGGSPAKGGGFAFTESGVSTSTHDSGDLLLAGALLIAAALIMGGD